MPEAIKITRELNGQVTVLTLNRPDKLNAISRQLAEELDGALSDTEVDTTTRVVIITGEGRAFSAGADIAEVSNPDRGVGGSAHARALRNALNHIESLPWPVIAAVNGLAFGGGCEIVLACDLVIADPDARFGLPEINIGVIPGAGGTQRLPRLAGRNRAKELLFFGEPVSAEEARDLGIVNRIAPPGQTLTTALEWARKLSDKPPLALAAAKAAVNAGIDSSLAAGIELERLAFTTLYGTEDQVEGMAAFLEKRPARFVGR